MSASPIPEGYYTPTPYLLIEGAGRLLEFLRDAFDAEERGRLMRPDGTLMHAEVRIGDSAIMLGEPMGEFDAMPASVFLYVEDCDAAYERALAAGAESVFEVTTLQHAGERYGGIRDPSGNLWWVATRVEDVPWETQQARIDDLAGQSFG